MLRSGYRPPIIDGFRRIMSAGSQVRMLRAAVEAELAHGRTDPYDSHPALNQRVAALEAVPPGPELADRGAAIELLDAPETFEEELLEHVVPDGIGVCERIGWEEVGPRVYSPLVKKAAARVAMHLEGLTAGTIPPNRTALAHLARALGEHADSVEESAMVAAEEIAVVIMQRLVEVGWRLEATPGRAIVAVHGEHRFDVITQLRGLAM